MMQHRSTLYEVLKEIRRLNLFPKELATQKQIATSDMYINAMDEETPLAVKFIKKKLLNTMERNNAFIFSR